MGGSQIPLFHAFRATYEQQAIGRAGQPQTNGHGGGLPAPVPVFASIDNGSYFDKDPLMGSRHRALNREIIFFFLVQVPASF